MNEIINVNFDNTDRPTVMGRELHKALEIRTAYKDWFPRMCEYGFTEGEDYTPLIFEHPQNKQPFTDHQLTISMAKELCMIQRTDRGKQCRQYFIQIEEAWNKPEAVMARALQMANRQLDSIKADNARLALQLKETEPFVLFARSVQVSSTSILVGELAKLLKQNGISTGQNRLFQYLRNKGYLISRKGTDYNMPSQKSMELGLFEIKETSITHADGHTSITKTPKVTGKGQIYFINKFLNGGTMANDT